MLTMIKIYHLAIIKKKIKKKNKKKIKRINLFQNWKKVLIKTI